MRGQKSPRSKPPARKGAATRFRVIKQTVVVDASPSEVYEAYVDPEKHAAFTGTAVRGAPKVGEKFTAGDGYITGKYIKLESGRRILHDWTTTEWPAGYPPSILELTFKPKGTRTELTMVHSKVPAEQAEYYAKGWREYYWRPLKKYFARA
jgi:activator of HSP90 ATPase